jgi:hypothetical protein
MAEGESEARCKQCALFSVWFASNETAKQKTRKREEQVCAAKYR